MGVGGTVACAAALLALAAAPSLAQQPPAPIIDMHMHASDIAEYEQLVGPAPIPHCVPMTDYPIPDGKRSWREIWRSRDVSCNKTWSPATSEQVMEQTLAIMKRRNIFGVASGSRLAGWREAAPDRIIPSVAFGDPDSPAVEAMRTGFEHGDFVVIGEVAVQYAGMTPDDPSLEPYWAMAEALDIPVGIHIGTGPLGAPYGGFERYRARLHSALVLEEVLVKHPKLRVYIMHAGWPMLDDLLAVLWTHPQVYVDTGVIDWALPRAEFHRYLERIVGAGFGKRVLFGSDQMVWPGTIEIAIESVQSAKFLSAEQKRDIFFNNAARFLRLPEERIRSMHASRPPG